MSEMLSPHFSVWEFEFSQTAIKAHISNKMTPPHKANARRLCVNVLEPIRAYYNSPVILSSAYRSYTLNAIIPGASLTSQHCLGEAADFRVVGVSQRQLYNDIISGKIPGLVWDQVIDEFGAWVHISYRASRNRRQKLKARRQRGRTVYLAVA